MRFTQARVNGLKPPAGKADHDEIDEAMPGFGIRFRNGGSGTYFIQYRIGGKDGRLSLGKVTKITLGDAQAAAKRHFAVIADKIDPSDRARQGGRQGQRHHRAADRRLRRLPAPQRSRRQLSGGSRAFAAPILQPAASLQCRRHQPRDGREVAGDDQNRSRPDRCRPQPRAPERSSSRG